MIGNAKYVAIALIISLSSILTYDKLTSDYNITRQEFRVLKKKKRISLYYKDKGLGEVWCDTALANNGDGWVISPKGHIAHYEGICM